MSRRTLYFLLPITLAVVTLVAFGLHAKPSKKLTSQEREARTFLETITGVMQPLVAVANQAAWTAMIDVTSEHTAGRATAEKTVAAVIGSKLVIQRIQGFLKQKSELDALSVRQLTKLLLAAADSPATIPEVVAKRIEAEARQSSILDGYTFCLQPGAGDACLRP